MYQWIRKLMFKLFVKVFYTSPLKKLRLERMLFLPASDSKTRFRDYGYDSALDCPISVSTSAKTTSETMPSCTEAPTSTRTMQKYPCVDWEDRGFSSQLDCEAMTQTTTTATESTTVTTCHEIVTTVITIIGMFISI